MNNNDRKFKDCLENITDSSLNLLLGNGFSIGLNQNFDAPEFIKFSNVHMIQLFKLLHTSDFEKIMESILNTEEILKILEPDIGRNFNTKKYIDEIKTEFLDTIERIHPKNSNEIDNSISATKPFINNFENIFTLNYDLMLYWIVMDSKNSPTAEIYPDGFRGDLTWTRPDEQKLFFLHGALHLHTLSLSGNTIKNCFKRTGKPLIDQLKENLSKGEFPMVVLEGTSEQKLKAIYEKPYLDYSLKYLNKIKGCLFIHGCSFKEQDSHIYNAIFSNPNLKKIYIGRLECDDNLERNIKARIANYSSDQKEIIYYNARTIYS